MQDGWIDDVLKFWFEDHGQKDWFQGGSEFDEKIRERFANLYDALKDEPADRFLGSANQALAAILVLDQFPRNMFRDDARAFATDPLALEIARRAVANGHDGELGTAQCLFLYIPFEHSEDGGDQDKAVDLIRALGNDEYTDFAEKHRDLIVRFGRFPHRNEILGRTSTDAEQKFLQDVGRGF